MKKIKAKIKVYPFCLMFVAVIPKTYPNNFWFSLERLSIGDEEKILHAFADCRLPFLRESE